MIEAAAIVESARSMLGVPYRHQGRSRWAVDCIGLVLVVARELELIDPSEFFPANYTARPRDGLLEKYVAASCEPLTEPAAGCLVLIRWRQSAPAAHCAILTGPNMIHAHRTVGVVVEHGFRGKWPARVHSYWKLPRVRYP